MVNTSDAQKLTQAIEAIGIPKILFIWTGIFFHKEQLPYREENSPQNLATIRGIAFSLAKQRTSKGMFARKAQMLTAFNFEEDFQFLLK